MVKMILMPTIDFDENSPIPDPIPWSHGLFPTGRSMAALWTSRKGIIFIISDGVLDIKARMQPAGTWECYCQIHYHLHTESRCSAKKRCNLSSYFDSWRVSHWSEYLPCGGCPHSWSWWGSPRQGSSSSPRFAAWSPVSSPPRQTQPPTATNTQTSFSVKMNSIKDSLTNLQNGNIKRSAGSTNRPRSRV